MNGEKGPSVVAAGYVPLDIVSFRGRVWHAAGGTAGNVAAILGFIGWQASVIADLGDDLAGREVKRDLEEANVSVNFVRLLDGRATPRLVHEIHGAGHRYRYACPACRSKFPTSSPLRQDRARELLKFVIRPDIFFFDRLNSGTILLAEHFHEDGSIIVFEPSRLARGELAERAMAIAHVVKHADDQDLGLDGFPQRPRQVTIVTNGRRGALFKVGSGSWHRSDAYSYSVVDAGGAGDWTTAGLVHALRVKDRLTVKTVSDALRWAQALAAVSCGAAGARGLARQQSAEAVVRAAKCLEQQGERPDSIRAIGEPRERLIPASSCKTCLLETQQP